jgi:hypothetical protein
MANGYHGLEHSAGKRYFDDFLDDVEIRDHIQMPPPPKKMRHVGSTEASAAFGEFPENEVPTEDIFNGDAVSVNDIFSLVDNPDLNAVLQMPDPDTTNNGFVNNNGCNYASSQQQLQDLQEPPDIVFSSLPDWRELDQMMPSAGRNAGVVPYDTPSQQLLQNPQQLVDKSFLDLNLPIDTLLPLDSTLRLGDEWFDTGMSNEALLPMDTSLDLLANSGESAPSQIQYPELPELVLSQLPALDPNFAETLQSPQATDESLTGLIEHQSLDPNTLKLSTATSPKGSQGPQQKKVRGRPFSSKHIDGFPAAHEPLPPKLTLEQICWSWPNHIYGSTLRQFIAAGWSVSKIWSHLQETAQKSNAKGQVSNKYTKRILSERKRMEEEANEPAQSGPIDPVGERSRNKVQETGLAAPVLLDESLSRSLLASVEALGQAYQAELREQTATIFELLLQRDRDWLLISPQERSLRLTVFWMDNAHEYEAKFIQQSGVIADNLPPDDKTGKGMLERLRELVKRALIAANPPLIAMDEEEEELFRRQHQILVLELELSAVKSWTRDWKKQLEQIASGFILDATDYGQSVTDEAGHSHTAQQSQHDEHFTGLPPHTALLAGPNDYPLHIRSALPIIDEHRPDPRTLTFQSEVPAIIFQTEVPAIGSQNTGTSGAGEIPRKRGRSKIRMFPHSPSTDVVLTEDDLADLDHLLDKYPEHVGLPDVMELFMGPKGLPRGAYPKARMIEKLRVHHNAKSGSNLNAKGRDDGLATWIHSRKDAVRRLRRAREGEMLNASRSQGQSALEDMDEEDETEQGGLDAEMTPEPEDGSAMPLDPRLFG